MDNEKILKLRSLTGLGSMDCKKALNLFEGNINQSAEFLKIRGLAVCRRKPSGEKWVLRDYIDHIKKTVN